MMIHVRDSRRVFGECSRVVFKRNRKACRGPRCYMVYIPYKPSHDPASSACQAHFGDARLWRRTVDLVKQCHKFNMLGILTPGGPRRFLRGFFFPSMRERLVAAEGLEPEACKSRPGGTKLTRFTLLCSALLCFAALPCFTGFCSFALWLVDPLVLLLFCFLCSFFLLAGLFACLLACLLVSLSAGLLAGWLAWLFACLETGHQHSLLIGSHLQPLAANRVAASGRQCPPAFSSQRQPLAATCSQSSGRQRPPVATSIWFFIDSHLQPLAATRVAASGRQWPPAFSFHRQPLAATCSHLQPIERPQVAASGRKWPPEQVAASGRKWPQVAASGRKWPQVAAFAKIKFVPFCTLSETTWLFKCRVFLSTNKNTQHDSLQTLAVTSKQRHAWATTFACNVRTKRTNPSPNLNECWCSSKLQHTSREHISATK